MTRRFRITAILICVVLVALFASSIGMTAAIWTSSGAGGDNNTVAPAADSPEDWNVWAKYFDFTVIDEDAMTAALTTFRTDDYTLNLETVVIPSYVTSEDGRAFKVVEIGNQIFADITLKELAVNVYISPFVSCVRYGVFSNMSNLYKVVFGVDGNGNGVDCTVEDFAFMNCGRLAGIVENGRNIVMSANSVVGCDNLQI